MKHKSFGALAFAAGLSLASAGGTLDYHLDDLWTPCGTTSAKRPPRKHSTHKQNARKSKKARK